MIRKPVKGENHPTVPIRLNGKGVFVDQDLIRAIKELNNIGLETTHCCQGTKTTKKYYGLKDARTNKQIDEAYISIQLNDSTHFEFDENTNHLVIRWRRYNPDPYLPYKHQIRRYEDGRINESIIEKRPTSLLSDKKRVIEQ